MPSMANHHHQTTDPRQQYEPESLMSLLLEACIAAIISCTTPRDAYRLSLVSSIFMSAAESDAVWGRFLPSDYKSIISNASPCPSSSSSPPSLLCLPSKKELFLSLCDHPILIDGGKKMYNCCYRHRTGLLLGQAEWEEMLYDIARELVIVWGESGLNSSSFIAISEGWVKIGLLLARTMVAGEILKL